MASSAHALKGAKATTELWPPKPKLFEMPTVMSCCCLVLGTTLMPSTSSMGFSCSQEKKERGAAVELGDSNWEFEWGSAAHKMNYVDARRRNQLGSPARNTRARRQWDGQTGTRRCTRWLHAT